MGLYPRVERATIPNARVPKMFDNVWFVDSSYGDDGNKGNRREKPLATIAAALLKCSHEHMDAIYVLQRVHVGDTYPISVAVQAVHIIGNPPPVRGQTPGTQLNAQADTGACFTLNGNDIRIENFDILGGASYPCINFVAGWETQRISIINCQFQTGTWGVYAGDATMQPNHRLSIKDCVFGPSGLSVGGIYLGSNGSWYMVEGCFFDLVPGPQISVAGNAKAAGRILKNLFVLDSDTAGEAITFSGAAHSRWVIADNIANDAANGAITANPYTDGSDGNVWARNVKGGAGFTEVPPA